MNGYATDVSTPIFMLIDTNISALAQNMVYVLSRWYFVEKYHGCEIIKIMYFPAIKTLIIVEVAPQGNLS